MKRLMTFFTLAILTGTAAHAQTATDIDTQIRTTHDVVGQMTRTLRAGNIDPNLNLRDYRVWKADFDQRVEKGMIQFEREMNEGVLPTLAELAKSYLKASASTQLQQSEREQIQKEEWYRLSENHSYQVLYQHALTSLYQTIFLNLPVSFNYSLNLLSSDGTVQTNLNASTLSKYFRPMGVELGNTLKLYVEIGVPVYGYREVIYPYIRQNCESRLCVSLVTHKLAEAIHLLEVNLNIDRQVKIGEQTMTLKSNNPSDIGQASDRLYGAVLEETKFYPAEVATLPFDTN